MLATVTTIIKKRTDFGDFELFLLFVFFFFPLPLLLLFGDLGDLAVLVFFFLVFFSLVPFVLVFVFFPFPLDVATGTGVGATQGAVGKPSWWSVVAGPCQQQGDHDVTSSCGGGI